MNNLQANLEHSVENNFVSYVEDDLISRLDNLNLSALKKIDKERNNAINKKNNSESLINKALALFSSHSLTDLNDAKLMNRVDSKFMLPIACLPEVLNLLKQHYSVLEIDENRVSTYQNKYLDTQDMTLYNNHHNGKLNRYKVRRRRYVDTDTEFLEVKLKNNKKRTIKNRIQTTEQADDAKRCAQFIDQQIQTNMNELNSENLMVSQQSGYRRIALANEAEAERLTLDFDLWYQNINASNKVKLPGFFIAELKQKKKSKRSPFYQMMSANNIIPMAFSKYCIGCALLYKSSIKSNRFKPILSHIEKLNRTKHISFLKSI